MKARAIRASRPTTAAMMLLLVSTEPDGAAEVLARWAANRGWRSEPPRTAADAAVESRPTRARDADVARPIMVAFRRCCTLHRLPFARGRKCGTGTPSLPHTSDNDRSRNLLRARARTGVALTRRRCAGVHDTHCSRDAIISRAER